MKCSVSSYSFGQYINEDQLGFLGIIDKAVEMGFSCIEYANGDWMKEPDAGRRIRERAAERGIGTMTENHGFFSQDAARVEKLINTVAHPNFGALVDAGNFMCADEDPTLSVSILAPYAVHVHAKDYHYKSGMHPNPGQGWFQTRAGNYLRGAILGHGEANFAQSIRILKKAGYDGYVAVEFEGMEDKLLGIQCGLANLKSYIENA